MLCEGDPFFYGSFMHLYTRLPGHVAIEVIPGITGMSGCWTATGTPITWGDDVMTVLMGTLPEADLIRHMQAADALVIMKTGRNLPKVRRALARRRTARCGLAGRSAAPCRASASPGWPRSMRPTAPISPSCWSMARAAGRSGRGMTRHADHRGPWPGRRGAGHARGARGAGAAPPMSSAISPMSRASRPAPGPDAACLRQPGGAGPRRHALTMAAAGRQGRRRLLRRSRRLRHGLGGVRGAGGRARMARASISACCPASPPCSPPPPARARRWAMISAPSTCPTISSPGR